MATGNKWVPLTLELIEEGEFKRALDEKLAEAQQILVEHVERWGEKGKGAKAVLKMSVELKCEAVEEGVFSVSSKLTLDRPGRPIKVTASMSGSEKNGEGDTIPILFVRDSGSTAGNPRQMHIPLPDTEPADTTERVE